MPNITTVQDRQRGCGWRKPGGIYLMADGLWGGCGKLPAPLERCPVCNGGIRVTRGLSFINPARLLEGVFCADYNDDQAKCAGCIMSSRNLPGRGWLIGVGAKFYSPTEFIREALQLGVSKRIAQIPRDLKIGQDYVFAAHPEAITRYTTEDVTLVPDDLDEDDEQPALLEADVPATQKQLRQVKVPGIIAAFKPSRLEYVVTGKEADEELERLEKRGLTLVRVERLEEKQLEMTA